MVHGFRNDKNCHDFVFLLCIDEVGIYGPYANTTRPRTSGFFLRLGPSTIRPVFQVNRNFFNRESKNVVPERGRKLNGRGLESTPAGAPGINLEEPHNLP